MDVDHPPGEQGQELAAQQLHVAREHDQVSALLEQPRPHRVVARAAIRVPGQRERRGRDARRPSSLQRRGVLPVGGHCDDFDAVPSVDRVEQRLDVRTRARGEDGDVHAVRFTPA